MAQSLDNLQVQYTYHVHEGDGTSATGCYKAQINTCSNVLYATDSNGNSYDEGDVIYHICSIHGVVGCAPWETWISAGKPVTRVCGTNMGTKYVLNCGKTEETIESVTIIY